MTDNSSSVDNKAVLCSFCKYGTEVESDCGPLHRHILPNGKTIAAHHKCMQYSALLIQYDWDFFGGFKIENVVDEIKRASRLKCSICLKKKDKDRKNKLSGASAGCCVGPCTKTYHYYCAKKDNTAITKRLVVLYKSTTSKKVLYSSIDNETIENGDVRDIEGQLTFEVVENGSKRGKRKLVSSDGYTFVYKRTQKNGTVVWRCSVRGQKACPVVVNECNGMYQANNSSHIHPAKPGVDVAVKIFADVKELARTDHFETAGTTLKQVTDRVFCSSEHEEQYRAMFPNGASIDDSKTQNEITDGEAAMTCHTDSPASPEGAVTPPNSLVDSIQPLDEQQLSQLSPTIPMSDAMEISMQSPQNVGDTNTSNTNFNYSFTCPIVPRLPKRGRRRKTVSCGAKKNNGPLWTPTHLKSDTRLKSGSVMNSLHITNKNIHLSKDIERTTARRGRPSRVSRLQRMSVPIVSKQNGSGDNPVVGDSKSNIMKGEVKLSSRPVRSKSKNSAHTGQSCSTCDMNNTGSASSNKTDNSQNVNSALSQENEIIDLNGPQKRVQNELYKIPESSHISDICVASRARCTSNTVSQPVSSDCNTAGGSLDSPVQSRSKDLLKSPDIHSQASPQEHMFKMISKEKLPSSQLKKDCIICFADPSSFTISIKRKAIDRLRSFFTSQNATVIFINEHDYLDPICQKFSLCLCMIKDISEYLVKEDFSVLEKLFLNRHWFEGQLDKYRFTISLQDEMPLDIKHKIESTVKDRIVLNFQALHTRKGVEFGAIETIEGCEVMSLILNNISDAGGLVRESIVKELPQIHELEEGVKLKPYEDMNGNEWNYLHEEEFSILSNWIRQVIDKKPVHRINLPEDKVLICRTSQDLVVRRLCDCLHEIILNDRCKITRANSLVICLRNVDRSVVKYEKYCSKVLEMYIIRHMDKANIYFILDIGLDILESKDFLPVPLMGIVGVYCARDPKNDPVSCVIVAVENPAHACRCLQVYNRNKEATPPSVEYVQDGQVPGTSKQATKRRKRTPSEKSGGKKIKSPTIVIQD